MRKGWVAETFLRCSCFLNSFYWVLLFVGMNGWVYFKYFYFRGLVRLNWLFGLRGKSI